MPLNCEQCDDRGFITTDRGVRDCDCTQEKKRIQKLDRAGIPPRYRRKTFAEYETGDNPTTQRALLICRRFVDEWPTNRHRGIALTGPVGVGKTHLTACILMECSRRWSAEVAFVDLPLLFSQIKATFDAKWMRTEFEILEPLLKADVLAIDELAAARHSDWNFQMTEHILNSRYLADKSTIITTNFPFRAAGWVPTNPPPLTLTPPQPKDFRERLSSIAPVPGGFRESLGDRVGARMYSRLTEMAVPIEMDGHDRRLEAGQRRAG